MLSIAPTLNAFAGPLNVPAPRAAVKMAVEAPITKVAGDYGFDPLGLLLASVRPTSHAPDTETFVAFREAELKHGRLAMLAAVAWPLQEIFHPIIVDSLRSSGFGVRDALMETAGKSPSLLNGGLEQWEVAPALAIAIGLAGALEESDVRAREDMGLQFNEYPKSRRAGDFGFDPLNIVGSLPAEDQFQFEEKELLNGRLAMIAVTCYVAEEFLFQTPVVRFTPDLFQPIIFESGFRSFLDQAFQAASMDGSIDGVAY